MKSSFKITKEGAKIVKEKVRTKLVIHDNKKIIGLYVQCEDDDDDYPEGITIIHSTDKDYNTGFWITKQEKELLSLFGDFHGTLTLTEN